MLGSGTRYVPSICQTEACSSHIALDTYGVACRVRLLWFVLLYPPGGHGDVVVVEDVNTQTKYALKRMTAAPDDAERHAAAKAELELHVLFSFLLLHQMLLPLDFFYLL